MKGRLVGTLISSLCLGAVISYGVFASDRVARAEQAGKTAGSAGDDIPTFRYDPDWPKQLSNAWTTGVIGAIYAAKDDDVWVATLSIAVTATTENYALEGLGEC